jgi:hypothetical protein
MPVNVRSALCAIALLLAPACTEESASGPQSFPPLSYSYLTHLYLNVAKIEIEDDWTPSEDDVSWLSPARPLDALRRMAQDRLIAAGTTARAVFKIQDASLRKGESVLSAHAAVELDIYTDSGTRVGFAEARAARTTTYSPEESSDAALRPLLYQLTKGLMDDMNVEFEYQVRHNLKEWLQQPSEPAGAIPPPVQAQPLQNPGM